MINGSLLVWPLVASSMDSRGCMIYVGKQVQNRIPTDLKLKLRNLLAYG